MPRLGQILPKNAKGRVKELFDGALSGQHSNFFYGMMNSPAVVEMFLAAYKALSGGSFSEKERQLIQLVASKVNDCNYCISAHTLFGKNAGLTEEQTIEIRKGKMKDRKLNALTEFTFSLVDKKGKVSDKDVKDIRDAGYTDGHLVEITALVGFSTFCNFFNHVNQSENDLPPVPVI